MFALFLVNTVLLLWLHMAKRKLNSSYSYVWRNEFSVYWFSFNDTSTLYKLTTTKGSGLPTGHVQLNGGLLNSTEANAIQLVWTLKIRKIFCLCFSKLRYKFSSEAVLVWLKVSICKQSTYVCPYSNYINLDRTWIQLGFSIKR